MASGPRNIDDHGTDLTGRDSIEVPEEGETEVQKGVLRGRNVSEGTGQWDSGVEGKDGEEERIVNTKGRHGM